MRLIGLPGAVLIGVMVTPVAGWAQSAPVKTNGANGDDAARSARAAALMRDFSFAPPDASLVGSIHVANILKSDLVASGLADLRKSQPDQAAMVGMSTMLLGEIKEIRFAVVDKVADKATLKSDKPAVASGPSDLINQADILMLVSGKVEDGMLALLTQAQSTGKDSALTPPGAPSIPAMAFRRVDAETVLLGSAPLLTNAIERMQRSHDSAPVQSSLLESRAVAQRAALQDDHDFWIAGRVPNVPMTAGVGASVGGLAMGFSLPSAGAQDAGVLEMVVEAGSDLVADTFLKMIRDAVADQKQWAGLVETSVDHATIRLRAKLPKDLVLAAASGATGLTGASRAASAPTRPSPLAPPFPIPQKVRIIGLDDGERQIPLR